MLAGGLGFLLWPDAKRQPDPPAPPSSQDTMQDEIRQAEAVAKAFLAESDPQVRLHWARLPDAVRMRMDGYSEEARESPGAIEKTIGHASEDGHTITAFAVELPSGNMRLMEVVTTEEGPKVDWDAYARHGTASWQELWSGTTQKAVVRVFCEPSTERSEPFKDQTKWTCFRMSSPDMPQAALGFAEVGSVREAMMKKVVLSTPNYRQRFTLEIVRHEGKEEPLFEIVRCHAVGWIEADRAVEEEWTVE